MGPESEGKTMQTILLVLSMLVNAPRATSCETVGPRLDGTTVTICDGRVARVCSAVGCNEAPFSPETR